MLKKYGAIDSQVVLLEVPPRKGKAVVNADEASVGNTAF
jgi:hypothetical protein